MHLSILNEKGCHTLGALAVDCLDEAVKLLLGTLLVVTLAGDADAKAEWAALDAGLPDLLVQDWVDADIGGTLFLLLVCRLSWCAPFLSLAHVPGFWGSSYHRLGGESLDLLDGLWCTLLERDTMEL